MGMLLKEFKEKLGLLLNSQVIALGRQSEAFLAKPTVELAVEKFECEQALAELNSLINNASDNDLEANANHLKPFKDFLAQRWKIIKDTELSYVDSPHKPLSALCFNLAKELLPFYLEAEGNVYDLLMPTITVKEDLFGEVKDLSLGEFVLSDDHTRTITVLDSLTSAIRDGTLLHTTLINDEALPLSGLETKRVVNHSREANKFFNAIQNKIEYQKHNADKDPYSALIQLVSDLCGGGERQRGGEELNAGARANVGILKFHDFLELLDGAAKEKLMNLRAPGLSSSFGELWGRLCRPADTNYKETRYCVELVAGNVERIIEANKRTLCKAVTEQELEIAKKKAEIAYKKSNLSNLNINKKLSKASLTTILENIFLQKDAEQIQKTLFEVNIIGLTGLQLAIGYIKNLATWQKFLTQVDRDKLGEALLLKNQFGMTGFQYAVKYIKDPAILKEFLLYHNPDKLSEALVLKDDNGMTGFQYAVKYIKDPAILKEFLFYLNPDKLSEALVLKDDNSITGFQYAVWYIKSSAIWEELLPHLDRDKLSKALVLKDIFGNTGFQYAVEHITDLAIWEKLLPHFDRDKLDEALLLKDVFGNTGFYYAVKNIKNPAIWKKLLSRLSLDKLSEALLLKDNDGHTGFDYAANYIRNLDIWKIFLPIAIYVVNKIDTIYFWPKEIQNEIKTWKNYIANPKDSITGPHAEAYLQFLENAIPNNPSLIADHEQWLKKLAKSLSCNISEDKKERLRSLCVRVSLARYTDISVVNLKEKKHSKLSSTKKEILLRHIQAVKKIDQFSADESFQIANLLTKTPANASILSLHLRNSELKGHARAGLKLRELKNIYRNDAECVFLQALKSYTNNLRLGKKIQFFLSNDSVSLLKELANKLDKAETYHEREKLISCYLSNTSFLKKINQHPKAIEILTSMQKNYRTKESGNIKLNPR